MAKTEKQIRLETALTNALSSTECYPNIMDIVSATPQCVNVTCVYDANGQVLSDYSILEEAKTGECSADVQIVCKLGIPEDPNGITSFTKQIEGHFKILAYTERVFTVEIVYVTLK